MNKDEKYITIPFDVWESKYENLEKENEYLNQKLLDRRIDIYVNVCGTRTDWPVGYLDLNTNTPTDVTITDKERLSSILLGIVQSWYYSKSEAEGKAKELKVLIEKVGKLPKFIKWLFKIKL